MDLDRSLIDRIYTNLDYCYLHLPKRVIARSKKSLIGYPVYVLPEESVDNNVKMANFDFKFVAIEEEKPYGAKSAKTQQPGLPQIQSGIPYSDTAGSSASGQLTPGGHIDHQGQSAVKIDDGRTLSFDGTSREKIIMSIVAAVLAIYIYFKFLY
jgi:hypothetical protein